jgi:hypothetical protein
LLEDASPVLIDLDQHFDDLDITISNDELTFTFEIESPDILTATVDGNQLTLTPKPDASGKSLVTVTATDTTGKSVSDSFYVDIEAVNDAPVLLVSPDDLSYSEGVTQTVFDLSKIFFDADISWGNDFLSYSVVSNDNTSLATPSFVGDYLVVDYTEEETGIVTLKIRATDTENEFAEFEVEITITEAEAGVAAIRACGMAKLSAFGAHHQPVVMADGIVVVERHDDPAVGQCAAHDVRELGAEQEQMVEVDHIRPEIAQEFHQVRHHAIEVDLAHEEAVEVAGPQEDFVPCGSKPLKAGAGPDIAVDLVGRTEEQRFVASALVGAEEIVREDLRAAGMEGGMIVRCDEDALPHAPSPRRSATWISW